jgi:hypothetical protein
MLTPGSSAEQVSQKPVNSWMTAHAEVIRAIAAISRVVGFIPGRAGSLPIRAIIGSEFAWSPSRRTRFDDPLRRFADFSSKCHSHSGPVRLGRSRHSSTIDHVVSAMNGRSSIRCQECRQFGDLLRLCGPANRDAANHFHNGLPCSVFVDAPALCHRNDHAAGARGLNESGRDHIDSHAFGANLVRKSFAVRAECSLGCGIRQRGII